MRAILFDVDGVLLDSYAGYREVWSRWCTARCIDFDVVWAATHGRRPVETVAEVAAHLDPQEEYALLRQLLAEVGDRFPAFPESATLLEALPADRWAVVTSGERETVLRRFLMAGLPSPRVLVDGHAVVTGKPSPEGYLLAAELLGVRPADCLVVEDSPAGIAAGRAAGMTGAGARDNSPSECLGRGPHHGPTLGSATHIVHGWLRQD